MEIDFKWMEQLAHGGMTKEGAAHKDQLLSQGYTVSAEPSPFDGGQPQRPQNEPVTASQKKRINVPQNQQKPPRANLRPMNSIAGANYRTLYREACNFHERHIAQDHSDPDGYWHSVAIDYGETMARSNGNLFLSDILDSIMRELEREWKAGESLA